MFAKNEEIIVDALYPRFNSISKSDLNPSQTMTINAFLTNIRKFEKSILLFKEEAERLSKGKYSSKDSVEYKETIETLAKLVETVRAMKALYQSLLEQTDNHKNFDMNVYMQHASDLNDIIHIFVNGSPDTDKENYKTARELGLGYPFTSQTEEEKFADILEKYEFHPYHQLTGIEESRGSGFTESGENIKDIVNDYRRLGSLIRSKERELAKKYGGFPSDDSMGVALVEAWTRGEAEEFVDKLKRDGYWYPN